MVVEVKFIMMGIMFLSVFSAAWTQITNPLPKDASWNWKRSHEQFIISTFASFILIFVAKAYDWKIMVAL